MAKYRSILFVAGFSTARGGLFFSPIVLSNMLSMENYGVIERAQSIAVLVALVFGLGLPTSAPLILLREEVSARWDTLLLSVTVMSGLAFWVAMLAILSLEGALNLWVLIPAMVGLLLLQSTWSAALKARGQLNAALFLEAGIWFSALIGATASFFFATSYDWLVFAFGVYGAMLWVMTIRSFRRQKRPFGLSDLCVNVRLGLPLMVASSLTLLVTSGGRFILGVISDAATVGNYSVLFRATALPLVGHQMLTVAFFRQLYTWDTDTLCRRSPLIPLGVFGFVIGFWSLSDTLGWMLGARFQDVFGQFRLIGQLILSQTILWSAIALNDLLNARLQVSAYVTQFSLPFLVVGLVALAAFLILYGSEDMHHNLLLLASGQSLLMVIFYLAQCAAVSLRGHVFWRLWISVIGTYSAVIFAIGIGIVGT